MLPLVALVGKPNVGKSTLFNCLTRSRDALVADIPGLTRDRQYGYGKIGGKKYILVDTGGLIENAKGLEELMQKQVQQALAEATIILFLVDGSHNLSVADEDIARSLRKIEKPVLLVVNKTDKSNIDNCRSEFSRLGYTDLYFISAVHRRGTNQLANEFCQWLNVTPTKDETENISKIAIIGRPNVGKSTLVNQLVKENRVLTSDMPGTTRDSITVPVTFADTNYHLIDTAGLRKKKQVNETIEKFSALKTLEAIDNCNIAILMIDATVGLNDLELNIAKMIIDAGCSLVIALNKWDLLDSNEKSDLKASIKHRAKFLDFAKQTPTSALKNQGLIPLFKAVNEAQSAAFAELSTVDLNRILQSALQHQAPPGSKLAKPKLRYVHQGGQNPPIIVIHGNKLDQLPQSYQRYLESTFRKAFDLYGTPIRLQLKTSTNPFANRKNNLSPRQIQKKRRLMKFVKRNK